MNAWQTLRDITLAVYLEYNRQVDLMIDDKLWFWQKIRQIKAVKLLEFATESMAEEAAKAIIYAYKHPGTREAICRLCKGIFGKESISLIDDISPCVIASISIQNANESLFYALAEDVNTAIASANEAYAHSDLQAIVGYDPLNFFRLFLKAGTALAAVKIN